MVDSYDDFQDFLTNEAWNSSIESPAESLPPSTPNYYNKTNTEIQNNNSPFTTGTPGVNCSLSSASNACDPLYHRELEESQRLDDGGYQCDELLDKNQIEPIPITLPTFDETPTTTTIATVQHNNQSQTISSSSANGRQTTSPAENNPQTNQRLTTNENPTNNSHNKSIIVKAPAPLVSRASLQTDRNTKLTNCFGGTLTFILSGPVPCNMEVKMTMVHITEDKNIFDSLFQFEDYDDPETGKFKTTLRRKAEWSQPCDNVYTVELKNLAIRKQKNDANETKQLNGKKLYGLTSYLTGEEKGIRSKGSTTFVKDHELKNIQLAIRFLSNGLPLSIESNWDVKNQTILLSNVIEAVHGFTNTTNAELGKIDITNITPGRQFISFNHNNQSTVEWEIQLPKVFDDQLDCNGNWLEILIFNEKFKSIYRIDTGEDYTNKIYQKIERTTFPVRLTVAKQTVTELSQNSDVLRALRSLGQQNTDQVTYVPYNYDINPFIDSMGLNKFLIQFRLLPSVTTTGGEDIIAYPNAPTWRTDEFTEFYDVSSISIEQTTTASGGTGQRSTNMGLPIIRPATTTTEDNHQKE